MKANRHTRAWSGRRAGFTLLELMMVVVVVSILVTMAIPGIAAAKKRSNEASAIASLRMVSQAQSQYRVRFGTFTSLGDLQASGLIDENFQDGEKSGYDFEDASSPTVSSWSLRADPLDPGTSGDRHFFIDTSGVIRYNDGAPASPADRAID